MKISIKSILLLAVGICIIAPAFVYAAQLPTNQGGTQLPVNQGGTQLPVNNGGPVTIQNPIKATSIVMLFQTLLDIVLVFAVPLIVFFIIYAGFLYVTARGNASTIESAHKALLYALIGGLLILGARVLIDVIQGTVDSITK